MVFLYLHKNIYCGYLLETPQWGTSNEYPQSSFLWRWKKNINTFWLKKVKLFEAFIFIPPFCTCIWFNKLYFECYHTAQNSAHNVVNVVKHLGSVVQSIVSLTSSLRVISLTVLADSICNILIFFAEKMWVAFALQKLLTFFQQKISAYLRITGCKF